MTKVFIDTNIILDFFLKREPFCDSAASLFRLIQEGKIKALISMLSWVNSFYLLKKYNSQALANEALKALTEYTEICDLKASHARTVLADSLFNDKEDYTQYLTALEAKVEIIITRDKKDYINSKITVLNAEQFLEKFI